MLEVLVLGTAAGGGFPQWNCACDNCRRARVEKWPARRQSSLAISGDGQSWHLVNASPDVAGQLESCVIPRLQPNGSRFSPVRGIFLTNADLDHTLGLLQLREGDPLVVTAPAAVRASLERGLRVGAVLGAYGGLIWREAFADWTPVDASGLEVRAVPLAGGDLPRYDRGNDASRPLAVGYLFRAAGRIAGIFPDVAEFDVVLEDALATCDRVWFDGTFWSGDEMLALNGRTARDMGHVPVAESLPRLARLGAGRVSYLHINNTNPLLRPNSVERAAVVAAGLRVAEDGEHVQIGRA